MSNRAVYESAAAASLRELAEGADSITVRGLANDDWMAVANAESALALRELAGDAADRLLDIRGLNSALADLTTPLLAAVGAADLALERVNEITAIIREHTGDALRETEAHIAEDRTRLSRLPRELPDELIRELRDRLNPDELQRVAETYTRAAQATYNKLIERGEAALERLGDNRAPGDDDAGKAPVLRARKRQATAKKAAKKVAVKGAAKHVKRR